LFRPASFNTENIFSYFTKQAILKRRSTIQNLPYSKGSLTSVKSQAYNGSELIMTVKSLAQANDAEHGMLIFFPTLQNTLS
jgi:hypothetical protein